MQTVIKVRLSGHSSAFQLDEVAYQTLQRYLERARQRLRDDPDREEVIRDLELSIAERLAEMPGALNTDGRTETPISLRDMNAILAEVGPVDGGDATDRELSTAPQRRLCRVQRGQNIAGVCRGLGVYSSVRVDWVRTIFMLTVPVSAFIYIALMFMLPLVESDDDCFVAEGLQLRRL